jgi:hypothetical protein
MLGQGGKAMWTGIDRLLEILRLRTTNRLRVSDTGQVQLAFRKSVQLVFDEARKNSGLSMPTFSDTGIVDARILRERFARMQDGMAVLGFKPEHVRLLNSLCTVLEHGARVEATPANLRIFETLLHPVTPTTPASAEAFEEVVAALGESIAPRGKHERKA